MAWPFFVGLEKNSVDLLKELRGTNNRKAHLIHNSVFYDIHPSVQVPYFYVSRIELPAGMCDYLKRPIHINYLEETLQQMGLDVEITNWIITDCEPYSHPPYGEEKGQSQKGVDSFVYFIQGSGLIKIGVAIDPDGRLRQLQMMSPVPLELLATVKGSYELENQLHKQFDHSRSHGEWFETTTELLELVKRYS